MCFYMHTNLHTQLSFFFTEIVIILEVNIYVSIPKLQVPLMIKHGFQISLAVIAESIRM